MKHILEDHQLDSIVEDNQLLDPVQEDHQHFWYQILINRPLSPTY